MSRVRTSVLTLKEAAAEAWRLRLLPSDFHALSSDLRDQLADLRARSTWRPSRSAMARGQSELRAFHAAIERVTAPAFIVDRTLGHRAFDLWRAAERLEAERAAVEIRTLGHVTPATYAAVADAYLVASDAYGEAGNFMMAYRMLSDAERFRRTAQRVAAELASKSRDARGHATRRDAREVEGLAEIAREQGWRIERTRGGHWRFVPPDPTREIVVMSGTASDWRAVRNFRAALRRSGLVLGAAARRAART